MFKIALLLCLLFQPAFAAIGTRFFASLDETFIEKQHEGTHTRTDNTSNPFANINGMSIGIAQQIPNTKLSLVFKTNRLLHLPVTQNAEIYNNDTFLAKATVRVNQISDVAVLSYYLGYGIAPFIYASNTHFDSSIFSPTGTKYTSTTAMYYGLGATLFLNKNTGLSLSWIPSNARANTRNGINLSLSYSFLSI